MSALHALPVRTGPRAFDMKWLCFRVLVEVLLGTGMRISEALSLKRSSINFQTGEATIIGKGNKERVVFFSPRSLNWVKEYVTRRQDRGEALFVVGRNGNGLARETAHAWFRRFRNEKQPTNSTITSAVPRKAARISAKQRRKSSERLRSGNRNIEKGWLRLGRVEQTDDNPRSRVLMNSADIGMGVVLLDHFLLVPLPIFLLPLIPVFGAPFSP